MLITRMDQAAARRARLDANAAQDQDATRRLRCDPRNVGLPIIAMTASAMEGEHRQILADGMNDILTKPAAIQDLHAMLEKHILKMKL